MSSAVPADVLPDLGDYVRRRDTAALVSLIQDLELVLSVQQIDNFHITRRRMNSRRYHLGVDDLMQADKGALKGYYLHLVTKQLEEL